MKPSFSSLTQKESSLYCVVHGIVAYSRSCLLSPYPYLLETVNQSYLVLPCRQFSLVEIKTATNNFDDYLVIGEGCYGKVYQGFTDDHTISVAIKGVNIINLWQRFHELRTEVLVLSNYATLTLSVSSDIVSKMNRRGSLCTSSWSMETSKTPLWH